VTLYIDKATGSFISDPLFKAPVDSVSFKRGDAASVRVSFVNGFTVEPLADGAEIAFGIKSSGSYDGPFLVFADAYEEDGDSYTLAPNFNTESLDEALNVDGNDANDVASLAAMLEVTWSEDGENFQSSRTITANIANDLIRGDESTPVAQASPEDWLAAHGIVYDPSLVQLTGDSEFSPALDGIPTVDVPVGRLQAVTAGMRFSVYLLMGGTPSESDPLVVLPNDAGGGNEKYWQLVSAFCQDLIIPDMSGYWATLRTASLTGDRTHTLPNLGGTVAVVPTYADDSAAATGGLAVGDIYFTGTKFRARTV
jgi:hypothetical protein